MIVFVNGALMCHLYITAIIIYNSFYFFKNVSLAIRKAVQNERSDSAAAISQLQVGNLYGNIACIKVYTKLSPSIITIVIYFCYHHLLLFFINCYCILLLCIIIIIIIIVMYY